MRTLLENIENIEFHKSSKKELTQYFEKASILILPYLNETEKSLLKEDFDSYLNKGKFYVSKTFAGGIIFLREPEIINEIRIKFNSKLNEALAIVEYASGERNSRNVKYKPNAGKIEDFKWNMKGIFPNFNKYENKIKIVLIAIIGKIVKRICEYHKKESWFMEFEKEFEIKLFLDTELELIYNVEIIK
jgi:hypothetical protein